MLRNAERTKHTAVCKVRNRSKHTSKEAPTLTPTSAALASYSAGGASCPPARPVLVSLACYTELANFEQRCAVSVRSSGLSLPGQYPLYLAPRPKLVPVLCWRRRIMRT